ncbi:HEAT repeat domain-containing protein [Paenibacillus sp. FSL K6-1096]|uniref:HEAT repeat domain-containing protein n=1 Tax=Paenibacillus sp. FSL K6-1096 TaxID=2921460 RepID=UPI0030EC0CCE
MSTALLQELHQEFRRLYIAGSELAAGDFRLKRLLPQLQQLGERSPVFKKLGEGVETLLEPGGAEGAAPGAALLEVTLLLESVLYTQGTVQAEGTPGPIPVRSFTLQTKQPYRKLAPVLEALSTTGSGRYEVVVDAFKEGVFQDLRLLPVAVSALNDPYSELAEYAKNKILPSYGPEISSYLLESFNPAGGRSEVRKLEAIAAAGASSHLDVIVHAAENGSDEIRAAAIKCLGGYEEYTDALLEWSADKKKVIREAAYTALAAGGSARGAERLIEAFIQKKDREMLAGVLADGAPAEVYARVTALFMEELQAAPENTAGKKVTEKAWEELTPFLITLYHVKTPELDAIFSYVLKEYNRYISLGWVPLFDHAARYKQESADSAALEELAELAQRSVRHLPNYFHAAKRTVSPQEVFDRFGGTLTDTKLIGQAAKQAAQRSQLLVHTIEEQAVDLYWDYEVRWDASGVRQYNKKMLSAEEVAAEWDPRWLDWSIKQDALNLACVFARPGHQGVQDYLKGKLVGPFKRYTYDRLANIFKGLERADLPEPERLELLMSALEENNVRNLYTFDHYLFGMMERFPARYADRLKEILPRFKYECKRQLEYIYDQLVSKL